MPDSAPSLDVSDYKLYDPGDPFEDYVGPIYYRQQAQGVHCLMPTQERHADRQGRLDGSVLMIFADYALCTAAGYAAAAGRMPGSFAMTLSLTVQVLRSGSPGLAIDSMGEATQVTGRLAFVRGVVTQAGHPLATYSGVCRHLAREKAMSRRGDDGLTPVPAGTRLPGPPASVLPPQGFEPAPAGGAFGSLLGPMFMRQQGDALRVQQPTFPYMHNSGASIHGGLLMSFADRALCAAVAPAGASLPRTVMMTAEFLSGSKVGTPLESVIHASAGAPSRALGTGLITQAGANLLSFSALLACDA